MGSVPQIVHPLTGLPLPRFQILATNVRAQVDALSQVKTSLGARTLKVPLPADAGSAFVVEDVDDDAGTNAITIDGDGATIDGAATLTLDTDGIVAVFVHDGSEWTRSLVVRRQLDEDSLTYTKLADVPLGGELPETWTFLHLAAAGNKIGRASCRER